MHLRASRPTIRCASSTRRAVTPPIYVGGSLMKITVRLTNVQTYAGNTMVGDYRLAYAQSGLTGRSLLTTLTGCAGDGSCLPATSLTWTNSDPVQFSNLGAAASAGNWAGFSLTSADTNGDGRADLVVYYIGVSGWSVVVSTSNGDGTFAGPTTFFSGGNWSGFNFSTADVNGDGRADLVATYIGVNGWTVAVALSKSDGSFAPAVVTPFTGNYGSFNTFVGDVTGDGRADAVASYIGVSGWSVVVLPSNGDGTFSTPIQSASTGNWSGFNFSSADVTGDGKAGFDRLLCRGQRLRVSRSGWRRAMVPMPTRWHGPGIARR